MKKAAIILLLLSHQFCYSQNSGWFLQPNNFVPKGIFKSNNFIYVACEGGVVYKSSDNGNNWVSIKEQDGNYLNCVYFINEMTGIVSGRSYTFRTTNGGMRWDQVYALGRSINSIAFINDSIGYSVGGDGYPYNIILKTTNQGINWISQNIGTNLTFRDIKFIDNNHGFMVGDSGLIMLTTNGGLNWQRQQSFTPLKLKSVYFINNITGWTAGENGNIYYSSNSGLNWASQVTSVNYNINQIYFLDNVYGICALDSGRLLMTSNGGNNWQLKILNPRQNFYSGIMLDSNTSCAFGGLSIGSYGYDNYREYSVCKSTNRGLNWDSTMSGANNILMCVYFVDTLIGYVGGDGIYPPSYTNVGSISKTTNGGNTWQLQNTGISSAISSIFFINRNIGWALGYYSQVIRTTNGGLNWTQTATGIASGFHNKVIFFDSLNGLIACGNIKRTTDGGYNWITDTSVSNVNDIFFVNNEIGWVVGGFGNFYNNYSKIYKTTNHGSTWILQNVPVNNPLNSVYFVDSLNGWTVANDIMHNRGIYKTSDGGMNWNLVSSRAAIKIFFINANTGFYGGNSSAIYKSTDSGYNWFVDFNIQDVNFWQDIQFINERNGWAVAQGEYGGYIAHTTTGGVPIGIQPISNEIPNKFLLHQNYPNPFNPSTLIKFDIPPITKGGFVKFKIYDLLGREVSTLMNEKLQPGTYEVEWDGSKFASGVYFYQLTTDGFSVTKKMVLIK